ncbi:MAG: omptin family outer membrane protease, partial [Deltaproteobacteria bacterium]|nr:omptin family outer membrane protease [Deltaproteobacteria bacterium]
MKKKILIFILFFISLFSLPTQSQSEDHPRDVTYFLNASIEERYFSGSTIYHISFDDTWANGGHGESRLEFPLDNFFIGAAVQVGKRYKKNPLQAEDLLTLTYSRGLRGVSGLMEDSDWIENDSAFGMPSNSGRDIYTTSENYLGGAEFFDLNYLHNFWINDRWSVSPIIGYTYYWFSHSADGCEGTAWGVQVSCVDAKVIDYELRIDMPYFGIGTDIYFGQSRDILLNLTLNYSSWVRGEDKDIHYYPDWDLANPGENTDKISEGSTYGSGARVRGKCIWRIENNIYLEFGFEFESVKTSGEQLQKNYLNGVYTGGGFADDKILASLWTSFIGISLK